MSIILAAIDVKNARRDVEKANISQYSSKAEVIPEKWRDSGISSFLNLERKAGVIKFRER